MALTQVSTNGVKDGSLLNADINSSAAIAVSKLANFVTNNADNRVITGSGTANTLNAESNLTYDGSTLTIGANAPKLKFNELNDDPDYFINANAGELNIHDDTNGSTKLTITATKTVFPNNIVGIGTTSPAQIFHVKNTGTHTTWRIENDNADFLIQAGDAGADGLHFYDFDNSAYRMTIANSGNVGIGTTSPSTTLTVSGTSDGVLNLDTSDSRGAFVRFGQGGSFHNMVGCADGLTNGDKEDLGVRAADNIIFASGGSTERMRIASDGNVGIGKSSTSLDIDGSIFFGNGQQLQIVQSGSGGKAMNIRRRTNVGTLIQFDRTSSVGSISCNNTSTSYNTSSDYRLKENVVSLSDAITRLKTLKAYRFNFIEDKSLTVDGFMAHEVTAVPEAITGTKDAVAVQADVDSGIAKNIGDPIYQGIDQSKLVPLLVAAVQELIAKVETLETA